MQQDPGNDIDPGRARPDVDPGDARREAVQQDTQPQTRPDTRAGPSNAPGEFEGVRRQIAASQPGLGPSYFAVEQTGDNQFQIQFSGEGIRQQATSGTPTLDADDVQIAPDGSVQLT